MIKKFKTTVLWLHLIVLTGEEIIGTFYEKELQKKNQREFSVEKVIKRNGDRLYVKWKGDGNFFNSWIAKKRYHYIN